MTRNVQRNLALVDTSDQGAVDVSSTPANWDDIIARVYDVALDPSRYEDLLDHWETTLAPLRGHDTVLIDDAAVLDHFDRATAFLERATERSEVSAIEALMAEFGATATTLIGKDLTILAVNDAASRILGVTSGVTLNTMDLEEVDLTALAQQCARMLAHGGARTAVYRARALDAGKLVVLHLRRIDLSPETPVVAAITSSLSWPEGFSDILGTAFDLTKAECDIVRLLVECCSIKDIAETRGRSVETVRGQLKTILSKTETRSQVELVRLAMSMMDIATLTLETDPAPRAVSEGFKTLEPRPFKTVRGADGRALDYLILGDPSGTPILYLHMDFGFSRWPASAEADAKAKGLKIIAPVRAGFGNSDAVPKTADFGRQVASDLVTLLEALDIGPCPVIALGGDHLFAIELDLIKPGQVTALVAAGGVFPFLRPEQFQRMHKWHRFIQAGARYTPQVLPFLVKAGFHLAKRSGKRAFVHSVFGDSPADIATFEDPEVYEAMVVGTEICLSEDHNAFDAFAKQSLFELGPEAHDLVQKSEGRFPFISLNGAQDPGVHVDTVAEYEQDYPWIDFKVFEDCGQLLFFRRWQDVLTATLNLRN